MGIMERKVVRPLLTGAHQLLAAPSLNLTLILTSLQIVFTPQSFAITLVEITGTPAPMVRSYDFPSRKDLNKKVYTDSWQDNTPVDEQWIDGVNTTGPKFVPAPESKPRVCGSFDPLPSGSLNKTAPKCSPMGRQSSLNSSISIPIMAGLLTGLHMMLGETPPLSNDWKGHAQLAGSPEQQSGGNCPSYVLQFGFDPSMQSSLQWSSLYDDPDFLLYTPEMMGDDARPFRNFVTSLKDWIANARAIRAHWLTNAPSWFSDYARRSASATECNAMQRYYVSPMFDAPVGAGGSMVTLGGRTHDLEGYCWLINFGSDPRGNAGDDKGHGHPARMLMHYLVNGLLHSDYRQGDFFPWAAPTAHMPGWLKARYLALGIPISAIEKNYIIHEFQLFPVSNGFYVRQFFSHLAGRRCPGGASAGDPEPISLILNEEAYAREKPVWVAFSLDPRKPHLISSWRASSAAPLLVRPTSPWTEKDLPTLTAEHLFGTWSFGGRSDGTKEGGKVAWDSGYSALATLDSNQDGKIDGDEARELALWSDANRDGNVDRGELRTLEDHGIQSLALGPVKENSDGDIEVKEGFVKRLPSGGLIHGRTVDWFGITKPTEKAS